MPRMMMMLSRAVRRVPLEWEHPRDERGHHIPLFDRDYSAAASDWDRECAEWDRGEYPDYASESSKAMGYAEWAGDRPCAESYMPVFPSDAKLGICMYEEVTEGTPISGVYPDTPQGRSDLAEFLADNPTGVTAGMTADEWLQIISGGLGAKDIHTGEIDIAP